LTKVANIVPFQIIFYLTFFICFLANYLPFLVDDKTKKNSESPTQANTDIPRDTISISEALSSDDDISLKLFLVDVNSDLRDKPGYIFPKTQLIFRNLNPTNVPSCSSIISKVAGLANA